MRIVLTVATGSMKGGMTVQMKSFSSQHAAQTSMAKDDFRCSCLEITPGSTEVKKKGPLRNMTEGSLKWVREGDRLAFYQNNRLTV